MDLENQYQKETYLSVLIASLEKKGELLVQLLELSKQQETLIKSDRIDDEAFDKVIDEKDQRIKMILKLDEGFDKIYANIKDELTVNQSRYTKEIQKLKALITEVTDLGVQLQVIEKQNKTRMETYFQTKRKEIKNFKLSSQTATSYYKNMTDQHQQQQTYFFDKKK